MKKTNPNSNLKDNNLDREQYLYLTTRGRRSGLPREIEIWFTHRDGRFYVIAEYPSSNWIQNLLAHPEGQVRIAEKSFPVHARLISPEAEAELHRTIAALSRTKYGWGEGTIIELVPELKPGTGN